MRRATAALLVGLAITLLQALPCALNARVAPSRALLRLEAAKRVCPERSQTDLDAPTVLPERTRRLGPLLASRARRDRGAVTRRNGVRCVQREPSQLPLERRVRRFVSTARWGLTRYKADHHHALCASPEQRRAPSEHPLIRVRTVRLESLRRLLARQFARIVLQDSFRRTSNLRRVFPVRQESISRLRA